MQEQTDRQTTEVGKDRWRQTHKWIDRQNKAEAGMDRQTDRHKQQTDRQADNRGRNRSTDIQTNSQRNKLKDNSLVDNDRAEFASID